MKTIAVLGAGGFVGNRLFSRLGAFGDCTYVPVLSGHRGMAGLCQRAGLQARLADVTSEAAIYEALDGCDVVVNLTTGTPASIVSGTMNIYQACHRRHIERLVHVSSAVVYGDGTSSSADADPPLAGHWMPYARAKAFAEDWLRNPPCDYPRCTILRPGLVWGPGSQHTFEMAKAINDKSFVVCNHGEGFFNGIYVDNLVDVLMKVAEGESNLDGFFNVGDRSPARWSELLEMLAPRLGCNWRDLPMFEGQRTPLTPRGVLDRILQLSVVEPTLSRWKSRIPAEVKNAVKEFLAGDYVFEDRPMRYASSGNIDREHIALMTQQVKFPVGELEKKIGPYGAVDLEAAISRTIQWLAFTGFKVGS